MHCKTKMLSMLVLLSVLAVELGRSELIFIEGNPDIQPAKLELPGIVVETNGESLIKKIRGEHAVTLEQGQSGSQQDENIQSRQLLNAFSPFSLNPFESVVDFDNNPIRAISKVCIACTCLIGRRSCREAGGVMVFTTGTGVVAAAAATCTAAQPCVFDAPASLSACDPSCRPFDPATCNPAIVGSTCPRAALPQTETLHCNTPCQDLPPGAEVECSNQFQNTKVISKAPPPCSSFAKRSTDENDGSSQRDSRFLKLFANGGGFGRIPVRQTAYVPGAELRYIPTTSCMSKTIANAPYCKAR